MQESILKPFETANPPISIVPKIAKKWREKKFHVLIILFVDVCNIVCFY